MSTTILDNATIIEFTGRDTVTDPLTDLLRKGARDLTYLALRDQARDVRSRMDEIPAHLTEGDLAA